MTSTDQGLMLAAVLFGIGVVGLLTRRNVLFTLLSLEVMLNAAGFAFVVAGAHWGTADGQVMFLFTLAVAAAEVSIGLALVLELRRHVQTMSTDAASNLRG